MFQKVGWAFSQNDISMLKLAANGEIVVVYILIDVMRCDVIRNASVIITLFEYLLFRNFCQLFQCSKVNFEFTQDVRNTFEG